jgi:hypothetical protein
MGWYPELCCCRGTPPPACGDAQHPAPACLKASFSQNNPSWCQGGPGSDLYFVRKPKPWQVAVSPCWCYWEGPTVSFDVTCHCCEYVGSGQSGICPPGWWQTGYDRTKSYTDVKLFICIDTTTLQTAILKLCFGYVGPDGKIYCGDSTQVVIDLRNWDWNNILPLTLNFPFNTYYVNGQVSCGGSWNVLLEAAECPQ